MTTTLVLLAFLALALPTLVLGYVRRFPTHRVCPACGGVTATVVRGRRRPGRWMRRRWCVACGWEGWASPRETRRDRPTGRPVHRGPGRSGPHASRGRGDTRLRSRSPGPTPGGRGLLASSPDGRREPATPPSMLRAGRWRPDPTQHPGERPS